MKSSAYFFDLKHFTQICNVLVGEFPFIFHIFHNSEYTSTVIKNSTNLCEIFFNNLLGQMETIISWKLKGLRSSCGFVIL